MNYPIRVLCVFSRLDRGGAESMCMNLYRAMDRTKVQFDFVKHTPDKGQFEDEIQRLGGRIYEAPTYKLYNHVQYCLWWKRHLKRHPEHTIIHGHYFTIAAIYLRIAKRFGRKTITHAHAERGTIDHASLALRIKIAIAERDEKYSDYCFACSKKAGDWLFPHKEYRILKNAIDAGEYIPDKTIGDQARSELGILANQKVVGVIGSFTPVKNPIGVLEIFHSVHSDLPETKLLWCGDGPLRSEIEDKINELGLKESVILAGVRSDIPRMLQAMDVYIMPSLNEGLPVAGIEAQAAGIPCLFSDTVSREVEVTDCCMFLPIDNVEKWKVYILEKIFNQKKNTFEAVVKNGYDINKSAEMMQNFYLSM